MRVIRLGRGATIYTCNVYLVLGTWSRLEDLNALVDVGRDPRILAEIGTAPTGVGKRKIDRVVLTHSHYDHTEMLPRILAEFEPEVCALAKTVEGVGRELSDGDRILLGDQEFEVVAAPGHTEDSLCLYNQETGTLFSGDAPLIANSAASTYGPAFLAAVEKLCTRDISVIYPGHGDPVTERCNVRLRSSLNQTREAAERTGSL